MRLICGINLYYWYKIKHVSRLINKIFITYKNYLLYYTQTNIFNGSVERNITVHNLKLKTIFLTSVISAEEPRIYGNAWNIGPDIDLVNLP